MTNNTTLKNGLSLTDSRVISITAIAEVELIEAVELLTDGDWLCLTDTEAFFSRKRNDIGFSLGV
jgi:hypothetical protein